MKHTARIIHKDECGPGKEHGQEHAPAKVGISGVAFSVICCEDTRTYSRHTILNLGKFSDEEIERKSADILEEHANNHINQHRARQVMARLGAKRLLHEVEVEDHVIEREEEPAGDSSGGEVPAISGE